MIAACIDMNGCNCWYAILGIVQLICIQFYGIGYIWSVITSIMILCRALQFSQNVCCITFLYRIQIYPSTLKCRQLDNQEMLDKSAFHSQSFILVFWMTTFVFLLSSFLYTTNQCDNRVEITFRFVKNKQSHLSFHFSSIYTIKPTATTMNAPVIHIQSFGFRMTLTPTYHLSQLIHQYNQGL